MEEEEVLLEKVKNKAKEQVEAFRKEFQQLAAEARKGLIDDETFNQKFEELSGKLKEFDAEKFKAFEGKIDELKESLKTQGEELKKMKDGGAGSETKKTLREKLKEIIGSDDYKNFVDSNGKKKASFEVKAVSLTSDYTGGTALITSRSNRVIDYPEVVRLNIRDLLTVSPTDLPYLAFIEVYDWVDNIAMVGENTELPESSFKVREATADVKRIGTHIPISKRMLRSAPYVENHLASILPARVRYHEDFMLLFGDGAGNNPTGIFKVANNFATIIDTSITITAGGVASVATYNGGTQALITFAANQTIKNGDRITFASATHAGYNATFTALVLGPTKIVIDKAYVAEADTSAWTAVVANHFKDAIDGAQEIDVLKVAKALVTREEYMANGIVLNPMDSAKIETLKGNDEHYLEVQRDAQGILRISGVPVVETTAMPAGKFAVGDWAMAGALLEFTPLVLEFSESTQEKLTNTVEAIVHEEVIFAIYNKYMFVVGDFTTAKAALETP